MGEELSAGTFYIEDCNGDLQEIGVANSCEFIIGPKACKPGGVNRTRKRLWNKLHNKKIRRLYNMVCKPIVLHIDCGRGSVSMDTIIREFAFIDDTEAVVSNG